MIKTSMVINLGIAININSTRTKIFKKRKGCCSLANKAQKQAACRDGTHWYTKHRKLHVGMLLTGLKNTETSWI